VPLLIEGFMGEEVLLDHLMMQSARVSDSQSEEKSPLCKQRAPKAAL